VGDDVPVLAGTRSLTAAELAAELISWAVGIAERKHAGPAALALAHPSAWSSYRIEALRAALGDAGLGDARFMSAAEAAVRHHERMLRDTDAPALPRGGVVAVYDLGGGSFEATLLRKTGDADYEAVGETVALNDAGGALFDDLVLDHALRTSAGDDGRQVADTGDRVALARLRRACMAAKESLSFDADATIPVTLAGRSASVRITRSELEAMIDPVLERTMDAVEQALDDARMQPEQVECFLLVGGSSRIPLVAQRLSERFDRPLVSAPDAAAALGAAEHALTALRDARDRDAVASARALQPDAEAGMDAAARPHRKRRLVPLFGPASVRTATPAAVTIAAVVVAAGVATTTAGAAILRDVADEAPTTTNASADLAALDPFAPLFSGWADAAAEEETVPLEAEPAPVITPKASKAPGAPKPSGPRAVVRDALSIPKTNGAQAPRQSSRGPAIENAATPPASAPVRTPTRTPDQPSTPAPTTQPPPTQPPADPPADPGPSDPPTEPPADPTPSDPPTEPPADPTPDPVPSLPVEPAPSAPSADPT
jgi:hypothetical protein